MPVNSEIVDTEAQDEPVSPGVEDSMLAQMAANFAYEGEVIDERGMMRPGACIPIALFKDPNSLIPFRRGSFLVKLTFTAAAGPGLPNTLTLLPQLLVIGSAGKGESGADSGWGGFNGGILTRSQTNLGNQGSLAYAKNYVFSARGLSIYSERMFTTLAGSEAPSLQPRDAPWIAPYDPEILEAVHRSAVLSVRAAFGTCDYELDKIYMWNAMGGLIHSDTPSNSQGIARNMMKFQCPIISGTRDDDDKLLFILEVPETTTPFVLEDNGDVPFEGDVYVPVSTVIPGRQFCRPWDDTTCQAPGVRDARRRIKRIEQTLGLPARVQPPRG